MFTSYTSLWGTAISDPTHSYTYTALNQLAGFDTTTFGYDTADNLTRLASGATVGYDVTNQATSYTSPTGTATPLTYDSRGDRTTSPVAGGATGAYTYGQANRLTAATTAGTTTASAASLIAAGQYHSLAVDTGGAVWAWGYNAYGQLGTGNTTSSSVPVAVSGLSGVTAVGAGNYHALAVRTDGTVAAWGLNNAGQLGDVTTTNRSTPVTVKALSGVTAVAAGGLPGYAGHSVALKSDGSVWTWGYGKSGQLGLGTATSTATLTKVGGLPAIAQISANGDDTYALGRDGTLWAWGAGSYGQIGNTAAGNTQAIPSKVNLAAALAGAKAVAGGYVHSLVAMADGTMGGWGRNTEGEAGDGTTTVRATPVTVTGLSGITATTTTSTSAAYTYDGHGTRTSRTIGALTRRFAWDTHAGLPLVATDGTTPRTLAAIKSIAESS